MSSLYVIHFADQLISLKAVLLKFLYNLVWQLYSSMAASVLRDFMLYFTLPREVTKHEQRINQLPLMENHLTADG